MREIHSGNFGLIIAYLMPGFNALWGASRLSPTVGEWLGVAPAASPTVAGFLFGTLAAIAAGLIINAIRWLLVDPLHYASGVPQRNWDYAKLPAQFEAFRYLVSLQFRYYECYANTMVAIAFTFAAVVATDGASVEGLSVFLGSQLLLWSASRKTLVNYHRRVEAFLGSLGRSETKMIEDRIDPVPGSWYRRKVKVQPFVWLRMISVRRWRPATEYRDSDNLN